MPGRAKSLIVVSTGCPAGIGPEVSVRAAVRIREAPVVLVGDVGTLLEAAALAGLPEQRFVPFHGDPPKRGMVALEQVGKALAPSDRAAGKPSRAAGAAQLAAVNAAYKLVKRTPGSVLVTAPVSKEAIASSGAPGAKAFTGHTEWLQKLDGAKTSVMCFMSPKLATSLVTTHVPLARVPSLVTPAQVAEATVWLARLLQRVRKKTPRIAVAALNPHAGEGEMFGREEARAIAPGIALAKKRAGRAKITGPLGAETAFRKMAAGVYDGVVAMYHDQATIPMKLAAFGSAVNVTMGLSIPRTSVDHGTAYDIAWRGEADVSGMSAAMELGLELRD